MAKPAPTRLVALLRGINVGGHNVTMERLRNLTAEVAPGLGLANIGTYIQSGNLFFDVEKDTPTHRELVREKLEAHLAAALGWPVPIMLRSWAQLDAIASNDAFEGVTVTPDTRLLVLFLSQPLPPDAAITPVSARESFELARLDAGEAYIVMTLVKGRPGNPAALIEKRFGIRVTARFYGTLGKMCDAMRPASA